MLWRRAERIFVAYSTAAGHDKCFASSSSRVVGFGVRRMASSSANAANHYQTLGVSRDASPKEIKAAFYELSKKYHPDANLKDPPEKSAELFQNLVDAYEVLGSPDKKKFYDLSLKKEKPPMSVRAQYSAPSVKSERPKSYSDLDIDYKDFLHFQQSNRRRRAYQSDVSGYEDYLKGLGIATKNMGSAASEDEPQYTYKDSRAYQREQEEIRLAAEIEEHNRRSRYPLPTFEQLAREKEKIEKKKESAVSIVMLAIASGCLLVLLAVYSAGPTSSSIRKMSGESRKS